MKRTFIYAMMMAAAALVSCTKTELAPLKGTFPPATEPVLTALTSSTFEKTDANRLFTVSFSGENGAAVKTTLVGARNQYYLEPGVYGPGEKNLCFLVNGATTVNGQAIVDGQISVKKDGDDYRFIFVLFDGSGNAYRTQWQGQLVYEPDPEPVKLTEVLIAQVNSNSTVTVKLGTVGMDIDGMGTPTGDGCALTADLYSADGFLHEGTYVPASGEAVGPGEFAPGYEYDLSSWGMGIMHWGTCWWNAGVATHITSGTVEVAKKGAKWIITWGSEATYPNWAVFEGAIEALEPTGAPTPDYTYTEGLSGAVDSSFTPVEGVTTHNLVFYNKAGEEVAWFDLVLTEGVTDLSGEYICTEYAHEDHTFGNGYDLSMWGMGVGGSRYIAADGSVVLISPGATLSVANLGDGVYEFSGDGFDFIIGNDGGGSADTPEYTYTDEESGAVDSSFATVPGVTTHNLTLKNAAGEEVAWFQLVLTEGETNFAGEYECKEYAHEDHTFGNGYDLSMWGMGMGGTRYVAADGSMVMVEPGETLTVTEVAGGAYKFVGSTGYTFVCIAE